MSKSLQIGTLFILVATILVCSYMIVRVANANPDQILDSNTAATTSVAFLTSATTTSLVATTTSSFDTQFDGGLPTKSATLLVALTGSSSATTLNISFEYSQNNQDWFGDSVTAMSATTTQLALVNTTAKFTLNAGTSTNVVGATSVNSNTIYRAITVPTPTRYVRAVMSLASSTAISANFNGGNGSVWADIVGKKETR